MIGISDQPDHSPLRLSGFHLLSLVRQAGGNQQPTSLDRLAGVGPEALPRSRLRQAAATVDMRARSGLSAPSTRGLRRGPCPAQSRRSGATVRLAAVTSRDRRGGLTVCESSLLGPAAGPAFRVPAGSGRCPMSATASPSTVIAIAEPAFADAERLA